MQQSAKSEKVKISSRLLKVDAKSHVKFRCLVVIFARRNVMFILKLKVILQVMKMNCVLIFVPSHENVGICVLISAFSAKIVKIRINLA